MREYPKYLFSAAGSKLVRDKDQESALGEGWFDSPAKVVAPEAPIPEEAPAVESTSAPEDDPLEEIESEATAFVTVEKGELLAECERHGIAVDKRWGVKKLQEALASK